MLRQAYYKEQKRKQRAAAKSASEDVKSVPRTREYFREAKKKQRLAKKLVNVSEYKEAIYVDNMGDYKTDISSIIMDECCDRFLEKQISPMFHICIVCSRCSESYISVSKSEGILKKQYPVYEKYDIFKDFYIICCECNRDLRQGKHPIFSISNFCDFRREIPAVLAQLDEFEMSIISIALPVVRYSVRPDGQPHCRGHVFHYWSNQQEFVFNLPRLTTESGFVYVKNSKTEEADLVKVRPLLVLHALQFLCKFNTLYQKYAIIDMEKLQTYESGSVVPPSLEGNTGFEHVDVKVAEPGAIRNAEVVVEDVESCSFVTEDNELRNLAASSYDDVIIDASKRGFRKLGKEHLIRDLDNSLRGELTALSFPGLFPYGDVLCSDNRRDKHEIPFLKYIRYLLLLGDRRFCNNVKFLFYITKYIQKKKVLGISAALKKSMPSSEFEDRLRSISEAERIEKIPGDVILMLTPYCNEFKGSGPYMKLRRRELFAMIEHNVLQSSFATFFVTFSAADTYWPELFHHICPERLYSSLSGADRRKIVNENGVLCSMFFKRRFESLLDFMLTSKVLGEISDYWFRVEFQYRGSPHVHGLIWIKDFPTISPCTLSEANNDERMKNLCMEIDKCIMCDIPENIPDPSISRNLLHPSSYRFGEIVDNYDLYRCVSELQVHTCRVSSKWKKGCLTDGKCRFQYPIDLKSETVMEFNEKTGYSVHHKRNHARVNNYNPTLLRVHRANMDIKYITNTYAVAMYAAFYSSKHSTTSSSLLDVVKKVLKKKADNGLQLDPITVTASAIVSEQEISSQEAAWVCLNYDYVYCSRVFKPLSMKSHSDIYFDSASKSITQHTESDIVSVYPFRPSELSKYCMYEFMCMYEIDTKWSESKECARTKRTRPRLKCLCEQSVQWIVERTKHIIPVIYPYVKNNEDCEVYCKRAILLFFPFRVLSDMLAENDCETFVGLFQKLRVSESFGGSKRDLLDCRATSVIVSNTSADLEKIDELQGTESHVIEAADIEGVDLLSSIDAFSADCTIRDMEVALESQPSFIPRRTDADDYSKAKFFVKDVLQPNWDEVISKAVISLDSNEDIKEVWRSPIYEDFSDSQKDFYEYVFDHVKREELFACILIGKAGTGKSFLLHEITKLFRRNSSKTYGRYGNVLKTAYTGIAASNIGGHTLHSVFHLGMSISNCKQLNTKQKAKFANEMKGVGLIIIDEISFLTLPMLAIIKQRLLEIYPDKGDKGFCGISIILCGDFLQLPPVASNGISLYDIPGLNAKEIVKEGHNVYKNFKDVFELREIMRQASSDSLRILLEELRNMELTEVSLKYLKTAHMKWVSMSDEAKNEISLSTLQLFPTCRAVRKHNYVTIAKQNGKCFCFKTKIRSTGITKNAVIGSTEDILSEFQADIKKSNLKANRSMGKVPYVQYFKIKSRVMLNVNVFVPFGLCNGSIGSVLDICCSNEGNPYILVQFDNYTGPSFMELVPRVFPISLVSTGKIFRGYQFNCMFYPLDLAFAQTIHKVQGLTCQRILLSLEDYFVFGQAYVAFSRVKSTEGLYVTDAIFPTNLKRLSDQLLKGKEMHIRITAHIRDMVFKSLCQRRSMH